MPIARLTPAVRSYCRSFNITAIAEWRDGRLGVSRDPQGAEAAFWCEADKAGSILAVARACRDGIPAAAARLGLHVTSHNNVVSRATAAVSKIEAQVTKSHDNGNLKFFNQEYKRRRIDAALEGKSFVSYVVAKQRLRRAIAQVAAGKITAGVVDQVFGLE
jgi:hypothetical protein